MEPAEILAVAAVAAGAAYLTAGAAFDLIRWLTRLRLGWLPSLQRTLAAVGLVVTVMRSAPAGAALPPPSMRLPPRPPVVAAAMMDGAGSAPVSPPPVTDTYRVQPGDSLWAIAARALGDASTDAVDGYWRAIYEANRDVVGEDPDLIFPGQTLTIPAP